MAPSAVSGTSNPPRNAKRSVVYERDYSPSVSRSTSIEIEDEKDAEGEEEDAEGESEYESADERGAPSALPSDGMDVDEDIAMDEDAEGEDDDEIADNQPLTVPKQQTNQQRQPAQTMKIKFKLPTNPTSSKPLPTTKKGSKKVKRKEVEDEEDDELLLGDDDDPLEGDLKDQGVDAEGEIYSESDGEGEERGVSPSKLTARQRARGNQDLQETLLALPMDPGNKKLILTEAEKLQRREETARKRKRQSEQKIQDEMDTTINRLLRAQTSRSRSKLDNPSPAIDDTTGSSRTSPSRRMGPENTIRWSSSLEGDNVVLKVSTPKGKEDWINVNPAVKDPSTVKRDVGGVCAVQGCEERRKYRCVKKFDIGGCSLSHLKEVEKSLV